jgi:hypothetical protein
MPVVTKARVALGEGGRSGIWLSVLACCERTCGRLFGRGVWVVCRKGKYRQPIERHDCMERGRSDFIHPKSVAETEKGVYTAVVVLRSITNYSDRYLSKTRTALSVPK